METEEKLMLSKFITHLQETLSAYGDMPVAKLICEDEGIAVVDIEGFFVQEPIDGAGQRTLVVLDGAEVDLLGPQLSGDDNDNDSDDSGKNEPTQ